MLANQPISIYIFGNRLISNFSIRLKAHSAFWLTHFIKSLNSMGINIFECDSYVHTILLCISEMRAKTRDIMCEREESHFIRQ